MSKKFKLFYISTNGSWSGSEELWSRSAQEMIKKGWSVSFATKYQHPNLGRVAGRHYLLSNESKPSLTTRIFDRLFPGMRLPKNFIRRTLQMEKPALVILSQGNNIDHDAVMKNCIHTGIPYITITNLVTEYHFLSIGPDNLADLQQGYKNALRNYFVSSKNLRLHTLMLSLDQDNSELIYCPCVITKDQIAPYPPITDSFKIGLVGRIECFHKGYDLLLELAAAAKWRARPVHFNVYGDGPHRELLRQNIERLGLNNITLKGYEKSAGVWKENHLLFMPSRMEGVALSLIEAMFCHRAAVVTDVGDAAELIKNRENGFIAAAATVDELDRALDEAWQYRDDWEQLGRNAAVTLGAKYEDNAVDYFNSRIIALLNRGN